MELWSRLFEGGRVNSSEPIKAKRRQSEFIRAFDQISAIPRNHQLPYAPHTLGLLHTLLQRINSLLNFEVLDRTPHLCLEYASNASRCALLSSLAVSCEDENIIRDVVGFFYILIENDGEKCLSNPKFAETLISCARGKRELNERLLGITTQSEIVQLLFGIATKLRMQPDMLPVWFNATGSNSNPFIPRADRFNSRPPHASSYNQQFPLCYMFLEYVHQVGKVGDFARTGLFYIFELASKSKDLEDWITKSDIPMLMASGLGALYSQLSRKITLIRPTHDLPAVLVMSDYYDRDIPSDAESFFSRSLRDHSKTFLAYLNFWQDSLYYCQSPKVKFTLLEHFRILFLEQLLYPSLVESSDSDGGSAVAVLTYFLKILNTLSEPELVCMLFNYLLATADSKVDGIKSIDTDTPSLEVRPSPSIFSLKDLIVNSIKSCDSQTVNAALRLITTMISKHHGFVIDSLYGGEIIEKGAKINSQNRSHGALDKEVGIYIDFANFITEYKVDDAYDCHISDAARLLQAHCCFGRRSGTGIAQYEVRSGEMTRNCQGETSGKQVEEHLLCADDLLLKNLTKLLTKFLENDVEVNLSLTDAIINLVSCEHVHLENWLTADPQYYVLSEEQELSCNELKNEENEDIQAIRRARRKPEWEARHDPVLMKCINKLKGEIIQVQETIPCFGKLVALRRLALELYDAINEEKKKYETLDKKLINSGVKSNGEKFGREVARFPENTAEGRINRDRLRKDKGNGRSKFTNGHTGIEQSESLQDLRCKADMFMREMDETVKTLREVNVAHEIDGRQTKSEAMINDVEIDTTGQDKDLILCELSKMLKEVVKYATEEVRNFQVKLTRDEEKDDEEYINGDGGDGDVSVPGRVDGGKKVTVVGLNRVLTNAVLLQEFVLEIAALLVNRAVLFDEVLYVEHR